MPISSEGCRPRLLSVSEKIVVKDMSRDGMGGWLVFIIDGSSLATGLLVTIE